ncbi:sialic acid TRAP transporter permease protein SiaT [bacterium BMS3Abin14]|nr:sialic acid TRAP transporter permease protein SiaT [bacterium BMS3Abin14]
MSKLDAVLSKTEEFLLGVLMTTASLVLFANIIARYVFNWGFPWAEELVRYEIIWMVFLGGSVAARQGLHIGVDLLVRFAPRPLRKPINILINVISLVFCGFIVYYGAALIIQTRMFGQVSPALQMPMWMVQLAIPFGAGLMALRFAQQIWRLTVGNKMESHLESIG